MNNIDRFNECTARLFATLYREFPHRLDIDYHEWLSESYGDATDDDYAFCDATLAWLAEAGYVAVQSFHSMGAAKVVLTAKGLEVLKAVPDALKGKGSIGDSLVAMFQAGAAESARNLISVAFTEGFKLVAGHA